MKMNEMFEFEKACIDAISSAKTYNQVVTIAEDDLKPFIERYKNTCNYSMLLMITLLRILTHMISVRVGLKAINNYAKNIDIILKYLNYDEGIIIPEKVTELQEMLLSYNDLLKVRFSIHNRDLLVMVITKLLPIEQNERILFDHVIRML